MAPSMAILGAALPAPRPTVEKTYICVCSGCGTKANTTGVGREACLAAAVRTSGFKMVGEQAFCRKCAPKQGK